MADKTYSITQINRVMRELEHWIDQSQETLDNEESRDYPNEERLDKLQKRIDGLQNAYDALEEIE
mgnify:CR=1 FL=1